LGCDIHMFLEYRATEYKTSQEGTEVWRFNTHEVFPNLYHVADAPYGTYNWPYTNKPYQGRDYDLFAMLADVRNDGNITPLEHADDLRGVPDDATKKWRKYADDIDLHSITFYTLAELKEALDQGFFTQATWEEGCMSAAQYVRLRAINEQPSSWSRDLGGGAVRLGTQLDVAPHLLKLLRRLDRDEPSTDDVPPMLGETQREAEPKIPLPDPKWVPPGDPAEFRLGPYTHVQVEAGHRPQ
jgi:hypothetical protein